MTGLDIALQLVTLEGYRLSGRGYCALFTYLQRKGRGSSAQAMTRDSLWSRVARDVERGVLRLNGRLADSYLRCFGEDVRGAMNAWRSNIRPILQYCVSSSSSPSAASAVSVEGADAAGDCE